MGNMERFGRSNRVLNSLHLKHHSVFYHILNIKHRHALNSGFCVRALSECESARGWLRV